MKIAHEAPISIFNAVQRVTDYDYALVHLFETNMIYYRQFRDAVINGREVILDNSIFELGTAFDSQKYYDWIIKLQPTWYIIPDALEDKDQTLINLYNWFDKYDVPSNIKSIGVVQGKTYDEIVECYCCVASKVDKIGLSFDFSFYEHIAQEYNPKNKYEAWMLGRRDLLAMLLEDGIIDTDKPHHLLGCGLPQEYIAYRDYKWIDSMDSSNPVVHGLNNVRYTEQGLDTKISTKLIDYINEDVDNKQLEDIMHNIKQFRKFCNG